MTFLTRYLFPLSCGYDWFATVYVVYVLLTPFLNRLGEGLSKGEFGRFLLILFAVFSVIPSVLFFSVDNLGVMGGYSLLWFIFLHYLTMYIRRCGVMLSRGGCLALYLGCCAVTFAVKVLQMRIFGKEYWDLYRYCSVTVAIGSAALFLLFIRLPERHSKFWCLMGGTTFGVLLIHTQHYIRTDILWPRLVKPLLWCEKSPPAYMTHLVLSVIAVFSVCAVVDLMRKQLFAVIGKIIKRHGNADNSDTGLPCGKE